MQSPNDDNENEDCDANDLDNHTCLDFPGFTRPEGLTCSSSCQFDTSGCSSESLTYCGDGAIQDPNDDNIPEVCDGSDLGGQTCLTYGYSGGDLGCRDDCLAFDESVCSMFNERCRTCLNNLFGLCEEETCVSLGDDCVYVSVRRLGGFIGHMCVAENQCELCGAVLGDICNHPEGNPDECSDIGPVCVFDPFNLSCTAQ